MLNTLKMLFTLLVLPLCSVLAQAQPAPLVNPYGKFFAGAGIEMEMAEFAAKNKDGLRDVLLTITGADAFNAGIDGKTLRYEAVPTGTGIDYQYQGKTRLLVRQPYDGALSVVQVFLDGKTINLQLDSQRSKDVRPLHMLTAARTAAP